MGATLAVYFKPSTSDPYRDDGHNTDALSASGGDPITADGGASATDRGGNGGAGNTADGTDGASSPGQTAAGGGGGARRIRINTATGQATLTGATVSPSAQTGCFTQGTLKK